MKQEFDAMQSVFAPLIVKFVMPRLSDDMALSLDTARAIAGQRIESLPVPQRDRYIPYNDELPAKPLNKALLANSCFALVQILLSCLAYQPASLSKSWARTLGSVIPVQFLNATIRDYAPFRGTPLDGLLLPPITILPFIPIVFIWTLEAHRRGNIGSLWSWYVQMAPQPLYQEQLSHRVQANHPDLYRCIFSTRASQGPSCILPPVASHLIWEHVHFRIGTTSTNLSRQCRCPCYLDCLSHGPHASIYGAGYSRN